MSSLNGHDNARRVIVDRQPHHRRCRPPRRADQHGQRRRQQRVLRAAARIWRCRSGWSPGAATDFDPRGTAAAGGAWHRYRRRRSHRRARPSATGSSTPTTAHGPGCTARPAERSAEVAAASRVTSRTRGSTAAEPPPVVHVAAMPLPAARALVGRVRERCPAATITLDTHEDWWSGISRSARRPAAVDVFVPPRGARLAHRVRRARPRGRELLARECDAWWSSWGPAARWWPARRRRPGRGRARWTWSTDRGG